MKVANFGNESSLHSAAKAWVAKEGDKFEVLVDGFVVDIIRGDLLIEVQTRNFSAVREKLQSLVKNHSVRLVYPIAAEKTIVHVNENGKVVRRRASPKKGQLIDLFDELVRIPHLVREKNFELMVLVTKEEETRCNDGRGSWRRRGISIRDHHLKGVVGSFQFKHVDDYRCFLPKNLVQPFTSRQLSQHLDVSLRLARRMTYCLREMGVLKIEGKIRRALLYKIST
ncbi:hypothetical protein KEJ18_02340 [Candidatus Bathyarchaeota archaeon]|nr:hypothetical protein [Candidatus Bathyarchaeota archaeon]